MEYFQFDVINKENDEIIEEEGVSAAYFKFINT